MKEIYDKAMSKRASHKQPGLEAETHALFIETVEEMLQQHQINMKSPKNQEKEDWEQSTPQSPLLKGCRSSEQEVVDQPKSCKVTKKDVSQRITFNSEVTDIDESNKIQLEEYLAQQYERLEANRKKDHFASCKSKNYEHQPSKNPEMEFLAHLLAKCSKNIELQSHDPNNYITKVTKDSTEIAEENDKMVQTVNRIQ